MKVGPDGFNR